MKSETGEIQIKIEEKDGRWYWLPAKVFVESAVNNKIDLTSFQASMDNFCDKSTSPIQDIYRWRDEAVELYFKAFPLTTQGSVNKKS